MISPQELLFGRRFFNSESLDFGESESGIMNVYVLGDYKILLKIALMTQLRTDITNPDITNFDRFNELSKAYLHYGQGPK